MLPHHPRSFFQAIALALLAALCPTIASAGIAHTPTAERVMQQVVLIRHGIRSPTASPEDLAVYASEPWPTWPVAPGQLTAHGAALMQSLGRWYRQWLAAAGSTADACGTKPTIKLIADSTPRNRDSAAAMLSGLSPSCPRRYFAFAADRPDPLFRGSGDKDSEMPAGKPPAMPLLADLQQVLLGCHNAACLAKAKANGKKTLLDADPAKALKNAGMLSENLMLEYVQGFPMSQVGWGRLDAAGVARLITLHNLQFALAKQAPAAALARGGNMLAYIAATLSATATGKSTLPAMAPADVPMLILLGHDTDLASQAALLSVDWHNSAQPDNYPPGGALIFQLVQSHGVYGVRLQVALPTLAALRAADVGTAGAMHVATLRLPGCEQTEVCPLPTFQALVAERVKANAVVTGTGTEPPAE